MNLLRRSAVSLTAMMIAVIVAAPARAQERLVFLYPAPPALAAFAPYTVARAKGYYTQEGLAVEFLVGRGGADVAARLNAGEADVGGATGDTPIVTRPRGNAVKIVAVLGGRSLTQLVMRADSGIYTPNDLRGKRISVISTTDTTYYGLLGFLSAVGLRKEDVTIEAGGPQGVFQAVIDRKADVMAGVPDWIAPIRAAGIEVAVLQAGRFFPNMAQAILTSDARARQRPAAIRSFVRATLRGLTDVMNDPQAAAALVVEAFPRDHPGGPKPVADTLEYYVKHVYPGQRVMGEANELRLTQLQDFYLQQGIITQLTPVRALYTNEFLPR